MSPMRGYVMIRDGWLPSERKASSGNRMPYKDCVPSLYKGLKINIIERMENLNEEWAAQLATYSWLLGEEIGSTDLIIGIDQIVATPNPGQRPWLRIANHRTMIGSEYQFQLLVRYEQLWHAITSGHIFEELSKEESDERCQALDEQAAALGGDDDLTKFINTFRRQ
jgi:hypothetical protein